MRSVVFLLTLAGLLACITISFADENDATSSEVDGTWKLVEYFEDGKPMPGEVQADYQLIRRNGVQEITKGGKSFTTRTFEINAKSNPKAIDFKDAKGSRTLAIYELKSDQMRVAVLTDPAKQRTERPSNFDEKGKIIATYERVVAANEFGQTPSRQLDDAFQFIKANMIGNVLETKIVTKIAGGGLETDFTRRTVFLNLVRTPEGMTYDEVVLIKQRIYDLDQDGKRLDHRPAIKDRTLASRVAVRALRSTGELVGNSSVLTNSLRDSTGTALAVRMRLTERRLVIIRTTPIYDDYFAPGGKENPGASETTTEYFIESERLRARSRIQYFDVDPRALERMTRGLDTTLQEQQVDGLF